MEKYSVKMKYADNYGLNMFDPLKDVIYTTVELNVNPEELTKEEILKIEDEFMTKITETKSELDEANKLYFKRIEHEYDIEHYESYIEDLEAAYNIELNELWNLNTQFLDNKDFVEYLRENFKDASLVGGIDRPYIRDASDENELELIQMITFDIKIETNDSKEFVFTLPDEGNEALEKLLKDFGYEIVKKQHDYDDIKLITPPGKEQVNTSGIEKDR